MRIVYTVGGAEGLETLLAALEGEGLEVAEVESRHDHPDPRYTQPASVGSTATTVVISIVSAVGADLAGDAVKAAAKKAIARARGMLFSFEAKVEDD